MKKEIIRESSKMEREMGLAFSLQSVENTKETSMKESGKRTRKIREFTIGLMEKGMKENIKMGREVGKESCITLMETGMRENGRRAIKMEKGFTFGQTKIGWKDSTRMGSLMERSSTTMQMGKCRKEFMRRERKSRNKKIDRFNQILNE